MLKEDELDKLRRVGRISAEARELGLSLCNPGVKLYDVAQEVEGYIREHGCALAFPCNVSLNEIAAHYTPSTTDKSVFQVGDVVKIDCGGMLDGFIGDTAGTVEVGSNSYRELVETSKRARNAVAEFVGEGVPLREVGAVIENTVKMDGFKVVENLCGHRIDRYDLHSGFSVTPYDNGDETKLEPGMTFAVEPFATNGGGAVVNGKQGGIVQLVNEKPTGDSKMDDFIAYVKEEFPGSPFCARSCDPTEFPNAEKLVRRLFRKGILMGYNQLVEIKGGIVSQHEYTFHIVKGRAEVTTLP